MDECKPLPAGLHHGVCQVMGGKVTQVKNQKAVVKRDLVRRCRLTLSNPR